MHHPLMSLYAALLFYVLSPGVFLSIPEGASRFMKAGVHAALFAVVYHLTHKAVWRVLYEGK